MKGELLDNNKKKNMNIRLEDEREKNKKLDAYNFQVRLDQMGDM